MMVDPLEKINVFMLYAEEDELLKRELETHLSVLNQKGLIDIWHEGKIVFTKNPDVLIRKYLHQSRIILLLISAHFLAPECYGKYERDLQLAYERQQTGETQIIPVILRPCLWQLDFLAKLNPLPAGGHPVRSRHWDNLDLAFQNIAMGILNITDQLKKSSAIPSPPPLPFNKKTNPKAISPDQDQSAMNLIHRLFELIKSCNPEEGALRILPLVHQSLIKNQELEMNFKKYNFWKAFEKIHLYKRPVVIKSKKDSGRKSLGIVLEKENGTEWIYTLEKIEDLGGVTGQIRIFFPENGNEAKISSISL